MPSLTRNSVVLICFSYIRTVNQPLAGFLRADNTMKDAESSTKRAFTRNFSWLSHCKIDCTITSPIATQPARLYRCRELHTSALRLKHRGILPNMKVKNWLPQLAILLLLIASGFTGYMLGYFSNVTTSPGSKYDIFGFPALPPLTELDVPPQTVDGITATIEGAYADPSRVVFIIRLNQELGISWNTDTFLARENGEQISLYGYMLAPLPEEESKYLMMFHPVDWLDESQLDGQLSVAFTSPTEPGQFTNFIFDFELPIHPFLTFNPKKSISINDVDILLDRVLIAPATTYAYICYPNPSDESWILIGEKVTLNINRLVSNPNMPSPWIYDSTITEGEQLTEPGWTPPNKESRCIKLGFPIGDANPKFLALALPGLENAMATIVPENELSAAYEKLLTQGIDMNWSTTPERGTVVEYRSLPEGMTEKEAYHRFLDALGYLHEGPWVFRILLTQ